MIARGELTKHFGKTVGKNIFFKFMEDYEKDPIKYEKLLSTSSQISKKEETMNPSQVGPNLNIRSFFSNHKGSSDIHNNLVYADYSNNIFIYYFGGDKNRKK